MQKFLTSLMPLRFHSRTPSCWYVTQMGLPIRILWVLAVGLATLAGSSAQAQAPAWQTAVTLGPSNSSGVPSANNYTVQASTTDANGNVFLTGAFAGTINFGGTSLTSMGGLSMNNLDSYVAKYSPSTGTFLWALRAGSNATSNVFASAIAVSGASVYVSGGINGSGTVFGSAPVNTGVSSNTYVVKLIDAGNSSTFGWMQRITGGGTSTLDMATTGTSVYLMGGIQGSATFGGTTLTAVPGNTSFNGAVTFLTKLTDAGISGSFRYAGLLNGTPNKVAVNGASVYVAGVFDGPTVSFGGFILPNTNAQYRDIFITRLLDAGDNASFAGAQSAGGTGRDRVFALAASATGAVVTGDYEGPAAFGTITLPGSSNSYEAKWNLTSGTFGWAQQSDYFVRSVSISGTSVYLAGSFRTGTFGGTVLTSTGGGTTNDVFVAKFIDAGTNLGFNWVQRAGGTDDDDVDAVSLGGTRVVVQGKFTSSSATFGGIALPLTRSGGSDGFLATLIDATLTAMARPTAGAQAVLQLFPNPAHVAATVRRTGGGSTTLTLIDALGHEVRRYSVPAGPAETALDLRGLPTGLYLLREGTGGQKLLIE